MIGSSWDVDWLGDLERRLGRAVDRDAVTVHGGPRLRGCCWPTSPCCPASWRCSSGPATPASAWRSPRSSPRTWVEPHLERLGLRGWFPVVRTRDDVARAKPAPDLFLAACAGARGGPLRGRGARGLGQRCHRGPRRRAALRGGPQPPHGAQRPLPCRPAPSIPFSTWPSTTWRRSARRRPSKGRRREPPRPGTVRSRRDLPPASPPPAAPHARRCAGWWPRPASASTT